MTMRLPRPRHGDPHRDDGRAARARGVDPAGRRPDARAHDRVPPALVPRGVRRLRGDDGVRRRGDRRRVREGPRRRRTIGQAAAAIGLAGLTVGIFIAFFVQRPSAALERNAIFMPWVSIVLTTFWTRLLYLDDPATLDAKLGHAAKEASDELSAIALRYAVIDGKELSVAKEAARTHPVKPGA